MKFESFPAKNDPRWAVLGLQLTFLTLGILFWGFNRSPWQVVAIVLTSVGLDMLLHYLLRRKTLLFPLSAAITGTSLSMLTNFAHGLWLALLPPFFAVVSKHLFTVNGRHVYNPSLFGIVAALVLGGGMITPSPAYQWGGSGAVAAFVVTAALMLVRVNVYRAWLIGSFLLFYAVQVAVRAYLLQHHIPAETLFMGAFTSPAFYLFAFFMIPDPPTSPSSKKGQIGMAAVIVLVDLVLHKFQQFSTLFYAGFIFFTLRWVYLLWQSRCETHDWRAIGVQKLKTLLAVAVIALVGMGVYRSHHAFSGNDDVGFQLVQIPATQSGLHGKQGDIWERTDPKMQHIAKWLLSVGDAAAVADVNNDGLPDVFLTQPLKSEQDRAQLYLNQGGFRFEPFALPELDPYRRQPEKNGLVASATWFDMDNDGDQDLLLGIGFGKGVLLRNELKEKGQLGFTSIGEAAGIDTYQISTATNVLDYNRDGLDDLIVGNVMQRYLPDYNRPVPYSIFRLPEPEYDGDRRMFNVMHRSWHNANNADENLLFQNMGNGRFRAVPSSESGFQGKRWTMAIGAGDLNNDGLPDLYIANDFGPDELYINQNGKTFQSIRGNYAGSIGRDTYKGMNATLGDINGDGKPDIYVSNVHQKLQAEGSLLWINQSQDGQADAKMFTDEAAKRNALNEQRFGWGAAFADFNRDGRLDIAQANGMADDAYDKKETVCPDYWYWNAQIALTNPDVHGYADRWADVRGRCIFGNEANRLYLNQGEYFIDVAQQVGADYTGTSRGMIAADFDNDGDSDLLVTHMTAAPTLYRNDSQDANWLGLELVGNGTTCARNAYGSKVRVLTDSLKQQREVYANNGLAAQSERRLLFGLGKLPNQHIQVEIRWCGNPKQTQTLTLSTKQYHQIVQKVD